MHSYYTDFKAARIWSLLNVTYAQVGLISAGDRRSGSECTRPAA